jgi:hypothetical protein
MASHPSPGVPRGRSCKCLIKLPRIALIRATEYRAHAVRAKDMDRVLAVAPPNARAQPSLRHPWQRMAICSARITTDRLLRPDGTASPGLTESGHHRLWYLVNRRAMREVELSGLMSPDALPLYVDSLRAIATKTLEHDFLGTLILCCNFAPLPFTKRVGKDSRWRAVKDSGPVRIARRAYRGGHSRIRQRRS